MDQEIHTTEPLVSYRDDQKIANAGTFLLRNQDHTLGNLLKTSLLNSPQHVLFCGYSKPHPLDHTIKIKIQTVDEKHPIDALKTTTSNLLKLNSALRAEFEAQMKLRIS